MRTQRNRHRVVRVSLLICALALAACGSSGSAGSSSSGGTKTVVIGADIAKTGYISAFDMPPYLTLNSGLNSGNPPGFSLSVKLGDNKSDAPTAANVATSLVGEGAQLMMMSCSYPIAAAVAPITQAQNMVAFTPCTGDQRFGPKLLGSLVYGFGLSIQSEAAAMAEATIEQGWHRVYILNDTSLDYPGRVCSGFQHRYAELGGTVAGMVTFKNGDQSIASQVSEIRAHESDFDAIVLCSYPPGGASAVLQLRQSGVEQPIISHYGMDGAYWAGGIPNLSNFFAVSPASAYGDDPVAAVNQLADAYAQQNGQRPSTGAFVFGIESLEILRAALQKAGSADGAALNAALQTLGPINILSGKVTIDPTYHAIFDRQVRLIEATNGQFHFVKLLQPQDPGALVPYTG